MDFDPEQRYVNMVNDIKVLSHKKNITLGPTPLFLFIYDVIIKKI